MNSTRIHLSLWRRTWTLGTGTAVLSALGALLGGALLWVLPTAAVAANVIGYFYCDRMAMRTVGAKPLPEGQAPEVHTILRALAQRAGMRTPRLYLMPGGQPNAFATGRRPDTAAVAVTVGLLVNLPLDQIRGVLAHELSHIRNRDVLVFQLVATIGCVLSTSLTGTWLSVLASAGEQGRAVQVVGGLAALLLAPLATTLVRLGISRQREYLADGSSAELVGSGAPLADALEAIERERETRDINLASALPSPALADRGSATLFSGHPPLGERVRRLRAYDERARRPLQSPRARRRAFRAGRWVAQRVGHNASR